MGKRLAVVTALVLAGAVVAWRVRAHVEVKDPPEGAMAPAGSAKATFAGGCFWCMEGPFDSVPGVLATTSGYTGGSKKKPTYEEVSSGTTGHAESMEVTYDPTKVTYAQLLDVFWRNVDPTDGGGQFCDRGTQYRSAIFYRTEEERRLAEESKARAAEKLKKPIVTQIVPATEFYPAEDYHQDYYKKNPLKYKYYRYSCGRDARLEQLWGKAPAH